MKKLLKGMLSTSARLGFGSLGLRRKMGGERHATCLSEVRSILVIRLNLLGDLLFTLPALAALRASAPNARITMLVLPYTQDILTSSGLVDSIITADVNGWRKSSSWLRGKAPGEIRAVLAELREEQYDLVISFYGQVGAAFAVASGAAYTAGYASEGYHNSFDLALPGRRYESGGHESQFCLDLVRALGATVDGQTLPELRKDLEAVERVGALLGAAGVAPGARLVAIHPGALNMAAKRWPPDRWAEVADRIQGELGARVILVGSKSEVPLAEAVRREMRTQSAVLTGQTTVPQLAELLRGCDLFLGGDSGPLHLASALGVPSVSVYGPTDPANSGPISPRATVLRGTAPCIPCYRLDRPAACWRGDLLCMTQVTASEAFEAAREGMAKKGEGRRVKGEGAGQSSVIGHQSGWESGVVSRESEPTQDSGLRTQNPGPRIQNPEPNTHHSSPSTQLRRILVVKLAGIGDLLTAFPAMEALRRRFPISEITALVTPQSASILDGQGLVDRVITLDKYVFDAPGGLAQLHSVGGLAKLGRELNSRSFDAVALLHHLVTWQGVLKYAALVSSSGAPFRAGLDDGRGRFLNLTAPDLGFGARHEVEYWLDVVGLLGAANSEPAVRLWWSADAEQFADSAWETLGLAKGEAVVAIHPGTGNYSSARRWSPGGFSRVGRALSADGFATVVIAGPGEEKLARDVASGFPSARVLSDVPSPGHLAAFLSRCRILIGNDSGVSHVAAAAGTPVVAVFGPSNHLAWAPYDPSGKLVRVVRSELPCSPCLYHGHSLGLRNGCGDPRCLELISPDLVVETARSILSGGSEKC